MQIILRLEIAEVTVIVICMSEISDFRLNLSRRLRRMRQTPAIRALVGETEAQIQHLIQPIFVIDGEGAAEPIESMPGIERLTIPLLIQECRELLELGISAVALFPKLESSLKDDAGREALNPDTLILRAIRSLKAAVPEILIISDLALDPYSVHGHDGLMDLKTGDLANDATVEILTEMAILAADAGADFVAPSDMMDGRVGAIRAVLDDNDFERTGIIAYSAKFASSYYGPFRDAVGSTTGMGKHYLDKQTYQLSPGNRREALAEVASDEEEGADILMVKPAGLYLDIIREVREQTNLPLAAYQVSGEYSQIHAAAEKGWLDLKRCRDESLTAICRAGADMILTYFARSVAEDRAKAL